MNHSQSITPDPSPKRIRYVLDNNRAAVLKRGDRDVLQLLYHFTFLANYQIVYFLKYLYGEKTSTTRKRYQRFRERGLLLSRPYAESWGAPYKIYYYLSKRGFMLLREYGKIDPMEEYSSSFRRIGGAGSKDHFFAIRDAVLLTLLELGRIESDEEEESFRDQIKLMNPKKNPDPYFISETVEVVPDWIIQVPSPKFDENSFEMSISYPDIYLNFEVDSGTETADQIKNKIRKYIELSRIRSNEVHYVLFSAIDRSLPYLKYDTEVKNKRMRIENIKSYIIECFAEYKPYPRNIQFYVTSVARTGKIAKKIICGEYQNKKKMYLMLLSALKKIKDQPSSTPFSVNRMDEKAVYLWDVSPNDYAELVLQFHIRGVSRIIVFKFMEEGNAKDYDILDYHNTMMKDSLFRVKVDHVIGVYATKEELVSDVVNYDWKYIQFMSIDSIQASTDILEIPAVQIKDTIFEESSLGGIIH